MSSSKNKTEPDDLIFHWDHQAEQSPPPLDNNEKRDLDDYFDFLEQLPPHPHEIQDVKIFDKPFKL